MLAAWTDAFGWQMLIDKRTAAWRNLPPDAKGELDRDHGLSLLMQRPQLLKTPLIQTGSTHIIGWNAPNKILLLGQMQNYNPAHEVLQLASRVDENPRFSHSGPDKEYRRLERAAIR
jgi:hypothetical protein